MIKVQCSVVFKLSVFGVELGVRNERHCFMMLTLSSENNSQHPLPHLDLLLPQQKDTTMHTQT